MGCRKITYHPEGEGLEKSTVHFLGGLEEKKFDSKFCYNYYPFGLTMDGAVNQPNTQNPTPNTRLFNAGSELQELSNLYDTYYRQYDASLGRFNAIDPKATSFTSTTPYNFAFNDPVALNDPLGDCPTCWYNFDENGASQQLSTIQRIQYQGDSYFRNRRGLMSIGPRQIAREAEIRKEIALKASYIDKLEGRVSDDEFTSFVINNYSVGGSAAASVLSQFRVSVSAWSFSPTSYQNANDDIGDYQYTLAKRWDLGFDEFLDLFDVQVNSNVSSNNQGGNESGNWFRDHWYVEMNGELSIGAQASFVVTGKGIYPLPFTRGGMQLGGYVNLGSLVLARAQADTDNGFKTTNISESISANQGFGISLGGASFEYTRNLKPNSTENLLNTSFLNGLISGELNLTNGEISVGMMPSARWALGLGIKGEIKQVFKFKIY